MYSCCCVINMTDVTGFVVEVPEKVAAIRQMLGGK